MTVVGQHFCPNLSTPGNEHEGEHDDEHKKSLPIPRSAQEKVSEDITPRVGDKNRGEGAHLALAFGDMREKVSEDVTPRVGDKNGGERAHLAPALSDTREKVDEDRTLTAGGEDAGEGEHSPQRSAARKRRLAITAHVRQTARRASFYR